MFASAFSVLGPPGLGGEGGGQTCTKPSLDRWGCACKISSRLVQGFGFPLALHIPTDKQTNICTPNFTYIDNPKVCAVTEARMGCDKKQYD